MTGNHFYRKVGGVNKRFCKGSAIKKAIAAGYNPQGNISFPLGGTDPNVPSSPQAQAQNAANHTPSGQPQPSKPQAAAAPTPAPAASTSITKKQLESWLKDIDVKPDQYEVVNGRLNIKKSVHMTDQEYTKLPVPFGKVEGDFEVVMPTLKTFKNFPTEVEGNLTVFHTDAESIDELDVNVQGGVYLSSNKKLKDFRKVHKHIKSVDAGITVDLGEDSVGGLGFLLIPGVQYIHVQSSSKIEEIMSKYFKEDADLLDIQEELIDSGFKNVARV